MPDTLTFTSVHNIPGTHASAAFTSKTSEVFKEEHNIAPIIINDKMKYIPWGGDNQMPYNIRAKLDDTADTWIGACFFAKNVMKFLRGLLCLIFVKLGLKAFKRRISYNIDYLMGVLDPKRGCLVKII